MCDNCSYTSVYTLVCVVIGVSMTITEYVLPVRVDLVHESFGISVVIFIAGISCPHPELAEAKPAKVSTTMLIRVCLIFISFLVL